MNFCTDNGAFFAQLLSKKELVESGQVIRHKRNNLRSTFRRNRLFSNLTCCHWLEWRHHVSIVKRWSLTTWTSDTASWLFKVIRGHWPCLTPNFLKRPNMQFMFLEVLISDMGFHKDLNYTDRFPMLGPSTHFALRRFLQWRWRSIQERHTSQLFDQDLASTGQSVQNRTASEMVKVSFRRGLKFWDMNIQC